MRCVAACLLFLASANGAETSLDRILRDFPAYHTTAQLLDELSVIANRSRLVNMSFIEHGGVRVPVMKVSRPSQPAPVNTLSPASVPSQKHHLMLVAGEHARELITTEAALRFLDIMTGVHDDDKTAARVNALLDVADIVVFPVVNVGGREEVEMGDFCKRTSKSGVDLNRNYDDHWEACNPETPPDIHPGSAPFSEPETRILRDYVQAWKPELFLSIHCGQYALLMPHAFDHTLPKEHSAMERVLQAVNSKHFNLTDAKVGGGGKVGYCAKGTSMDYMHDILKVPYSFAYEIYGEPQHATAASLSAASAAALLEVEGFPAPGGSFSDQQAESCFARFNPISATDYESIVSNWARAFIATAECIVDGENC